MGNNSQYVRNNSPGQISGGGGVPSSGGYMGQGLGMGFIEPTSDANSTSFYSNNTSVNMQ